MNDIITITQQQFENGLEAWRHSINVYGENSEETLCLFYRMLRLAPDDFIEGGSQFIAEQLGVPYEKALEAIERLVSAAWKVKAQVLPEHNTKQ